MFKNFELIGGINMAVLKVKFDNILCFTNFEADFTYPKKLVKTPLDNEFLLNYPNIRYKKVNIIIGTNSSGKTSLGIAIGLTMHFIRTKEAEPIKSLVSDKSKEAYVLIDCAFPNGLFFRFESKINVDGTVSARYQDIKMNKDDTYFSLLKKLNNDLEFEDYINVLENAYTGGWNIALPTSEKGFDIINCDYTKEQQEEFVPIYEKIIKSFDPSIKEVFVSNEQEKTFIVKFYNGFTEAVTNGKKINSLDKMSSGTRNVINIAGIIYSIKKHQNGFYYVDEQFSFVNSDLELACLSTMIECLGDGEQLFFTTHNEEVMNISLPLHSFSFLKKTKNEKDEFVVELINASSFEKRNNVSIKNLYDNDYFDVSPNTNDVYEVID